MRGEEKEEGRLRNQAEKLNKNRRWKCTIQKMSNPGEKK